MKKLYEQNQLTFSMIWIVLYVVLASFADGISEEIGIYKVVTAPLLLVMSTVILVWVLRQELGKTYGLCKLSVDMKQYLYFVPLAGLITANLWNGIQVQVSVLESVLHIISMLCVGFIEEIIFRGFLFTALSKNGLKQAFIISSVTFGIGHIVNLLNGAEFLPTLLQILYAMAIGFLFTLLFYKSKCLWPCIITHGMFNSLSIFGVESVGVGRIISAIVLCAIPCGYALWIMREKIR